MNIPNKKSLILGWFPDSSLNHERLGREMVRINQINGFKCQIFKRETNIYYKEKKAIKIEIALFYTNGFFDHVKTKKNNECFWVEVGK